MFSLNAGENADQNKSEYGQFSHSVCQDMYFAFKYILTLRMTLLVLAVLRHWGAEF